MENSSGSLVIFLICSIIGVVIWFYLNRSSVRANEQIELLKSLNQNQKIIIEKLFSKENDTGPGTLTDEDALAQARDKYSAK